MCCFCAGNRNSGYKCVPVSDPQSKRWLADDPHFLASLNDLDRGLLDGGGAYAAADEALELLPMPPAVPVPPVPRRPAAPPPRREVATPPAVAVPRAARPINAARALDPSRLLDTTPLGRAAGERLPA